MFSNTNLLCFIIYIFHGQSSNIDLDKLTAGATKEGLSLHSQSVQAIRKKYVTRRRQFKRAKLRWRVCRGSRRSLGWVPFEASAIRYKGGQVWYCGRPLCLWDSYGLADYKLGTGSFSEDTRGRWYLNVTVRVAKPEPRQTGTAVGLDLGLEDFLATSDGDSATAQGKANGTGKSLLMIARSTRSLKVFTGLRMGLPLICPEMDAISIHKADASPVKAESPTQHKHSQIRYAVPFTRPKTTELLTLTHPPPSP